MLISINDVGILLKLTTSARSMFGFDVVGNSVQLCKKIVNMDIIIFFIVTLKNKVYRKEL